MPTWKELMDGRTIIPSVVNSADMLKAIEEVKLKHPDAKIETVEGGALWKLVENGVDLSNTHRSHYACWSEAREIQKQVTG